MAVGKMAGCLRDETSRFGNYARSQPKYGSTTSHVATRKQKCIKHLISSSDTLQGLSLKYGINMEELKRANKIWTNDSLFLRTTLDIPIPSSVNECDVIQSNGTCDGSTVSETSSNIPEVSVSDIFCRIDNTIATSKDRVKMLQESSTCKNLNYVPKSQSSPKHQSLNYQSSSSLDEDQCDLFLTPQPIVMTQGRKVKHSLKKLQQEQDEIFEL